MKLPEFNLNNAFYDDWKVFYIPYGPTNYRPGTGAFIQLATGELIVLNRGWDPDERRLYKDLNITVVSTADDDCPLLSREPISPSRSATAKPIPKTHLNYRGQQILLLDHDHNVAVRLDTDRRQPRHFSLNLSQFLENKPVAAYYRGVKYAPQGRPIVIERDYPFSREQRERLDDLKQACVTWFKMTDFIYEAEIPRWRRERRVKEVSMLGALEFEFEELGPDARCQIALLPWDRGTVVETVDYLYFSCDT